MDLNLIHLKLTCKEDKVRATLSDVKCRIKLQRKGGYDLFYEVLIFIYVSFQEIRKAFICQGVIKANEYIFCLKGCRFYRVHSVLTENIKTEMIFWIYEHNFNYSSVT